MTSDHRRLSGQVAIITGAASGIGEATAKLFATEGAALVLVDRDTERLATLAEGIASAGASVLALSGDVADEPTVAAHLDQAMARFGRVDVLFAAAGFSSGTNAPDTSLDVWDAVIRTNLTGSFLWSRAVLGPMREVRSGAIILVSSQLAFAGGRSNAPYLAAKGGIMSLMQGMAVDHAAEGIRVNAVIPGAIDTPMLRRSFARTGDDGAARNRAVARHPLGRLGLAEEVARAALFLACSDSSFTTGSGLRVDGGWLAG